MSDLECFLDRCKSEKTDIVHMGVYTKDENKNTVFDWSGSGVATAFTGTQIWVTLSTNHTENYMAYSIDGGNFVKFQISNQKESYCLAKNLEEKYHTVELVKVTESGYINSNYVTFFGFDYKDGKAEAVKKKEKLIWFIGDSITCGYGVEGEPTPHGFTLSEENVTKTYGFKTAKNLNADYRATAISGFGLARSYSGFTDAVTPKHIFEPLFNHKDAVTYNFKAPDLIVINLGINDISGKVEKDEYITAYHNFLAVLREISPKAHIVCSIGYCKEPICEYVKTVVEEEKAEGKENISCLPMYVDMNDDTNRGSDFHLSEKGQITMAEQLTEHIKTISSWN